MNAPNSCRRHRGEDGISLVELLMVMALTTLILAFVTGTIINALKSQRRQSAQVGALNSAQVAFERVTRDIRGADLKVAEPDIVRLDVHRVDGGVRTVTYARTGTRLVATEAATGTTRDLLGDLVAGQPLFLFHLRDGSTATGTPAIDPSAVVSITVRLQVERKGAGWVVDLTNRVRMRNAPLL